MVQLLVFTSVPLTTLTMGGHPAGLDHTCRVQRGPPDLALCPPGRRANRKQVLEDQRVALTAGDVKTVPAVFVLQERIGAVLHEILDHLEVSPRAGHHQRSPKADGTSCQVEQQLRSWKPGTRASEKRTPMEEKEDLEDSGGLVSRQTALAGNFPACR